MKKLSITTVPVLIALAASFCDASANAQTVQQYEAPAPAPAQHMLTRRDVYDQLVQAQQDGSLARADSIYYGTYWGWQEPGQGHLAAAGQ
jgi:hypothetical protein